MRMDADAAASGAPGPWLTTARPSDVLPAHDARPLGEPLGTQALFISSGPGSDAFGSWHDGLRDEREHHRARAGQSARSVGKRDAFLSGRSRRPRALPLGQIGTTSMSPPTLIAGGIEAEARQTLENIKAVLAKSGATMDDIVKCTVMMADMREWAAMNAVYATYFPTHKPARSSFGTSGLALGARVEIECLAYRP